MRRVYKVENGNFQVARNPYFCNQLHGLTSRDSVLTSRHRSRVYYPESYYAELGGYEKTWWMIDRSFGIGISRRSIEAVMMLGDTYPCLAR